MADVGPVLVTAVDTAPAPPATTPEQQRTKRRTAPVVAAVLAAVVLASAWVLRLSTGLQDTSQLAQVAITGSDSSVTLVDDTGGVPILDDVLLDPGDEVTRCVGIEARSIVDPEPLVLHLEGRRTPLADHVEVAFAGGRLSAGTRGCEGLPVAASTTGVLSQMLDDLAPSRAGWTFVDPVPGVTGWWYEVRVRLAEDVPPELAGASVDDLTLRWSTAVADRATDPLRLRAERFAVGVAEDAVAPIAFLVIGTLLFLGIHDRIDESDPKLALAPVDRRLVPFTDRIRLLEETRARAGPARADEADVDGQR